MSEFQGWIKLSRDIIEDPVFQKPELLQILIYCFLRANHKSAAIIHGGEIVRLKRGEFITGRKVLSHILNQNESTIYKRLNTLNELGYIEIKSYSKFSKITVRNYETYQEK